MSADDPLADLRRRFVARCVGDLEHLRAIVADDALASRKARDLIHGLSGAAGSFGFPALGDAAAWADAAYAEVATPSDDAVQTVLALLEDTVSAAR